MIKISKTTLPSKLSSESVYEYCVRNGFYEKKMLAKLGSGDRSHIVIANVREVEDGMQIASMYSACGSKKITSNISLYPVESENCNCKKCMKKYNS